MASRTSLLKSLTVAQLNELAKRHNVAPPSGKKGERVAFLAQELPISDAELEAVVDGYQADKLIGTIRDARDYFLTQSHPDEESLLRRGDCQGRERGAALRASKPRTGRSRRAGSSGSPAAAAEGG